MKTTPKRKIAKNTSQQHLPLKHLLYRTTLEWGGGWCRAEKVASYKLYHSSSLKNVIVRFPQFNTHTHTHIHTIKCKVFKKYNPLLPVII